MPSRPWHRFWADKTTPLHHRDTPEYYSSYAQELRVLFGDRAPRSVLEIGCGNGALYQFLGFHRAAVYKGVDFSASMLAEFARHHPRAVLVWADGHTFRDSSVYDLVFANGVVQYFDRPMVREFLANARSMMGPSSCLVLGSIPWRAHRLRYHRGDFLGRRRSWRARYLGLVVGWLRDRMGTWFSPAQIEHWAEEAGMTASLLGSMHYPYRFHVVCRTKRSVESAGPDGLASGFVGPDGVASGFVGPDGAASGWGRVA